MLSLIEIEPTSCSKRAILGYPHNRGIILKLEEWDQRQLWFDFTLGIEIQCKDNPVYKHKDNYLYSLLDYILYRSPFSFKLNFLNLLRHYYEKIRKSLHDNVSLDYVDIKEINRILLQVLRDYPEFKHTIKKTTPYTNIVKLSYNDLIEYFEKQLIMFFNSNLYIADCYSFQQVFKKYNQPYYILELCNYYNDNDKFKDFEHIVNNMVGIFAYGGRYCYFNNDENFMMIKMLLEEKNYRVTYKTFDTED